MEVVKISEVKPNPKNPRFIKDQKFKQLVTSIREFPDMLNKRPLVVFTDTDGKYVVLGGNMRLKACEEIGIKEIPIVIADEWTEEQKNEFLIKDNVGFGEWDWDTLANEWDADQLTHWGLELPIATETEKLSVLQFEDVYYTPTEKPNITLSDCLNLDKFNAKKEIIQNSDLSEDQKNILTFFAYRFIQIDFENVANYYFFNADEKEKEIIERLRLVLCDNGINGFIEDDLLRIHKQILDWEND
jgi:hypothetical protein